jgi:hypothetical protein
MYVTVQIQARTGTALLAIPENTLRPGNRVWQVVDGRLAIKRVRVAHTDSDLVLLHAEGSDLQPGAKLVRSPLASAMEGMLIQERAVE